MLVWYDRHLSNWDMECVGLGPPSLDETANKRPIYADVA